MVQLKEEKTEVNCLVFILERLWTHLAEGNTHIQGHRLIQALLCLPWQPRSPGPQHFTCPGFAGPFRSLGGVCAVRDPRSR